MRATNRPISRRSVRRFGRRVQNLGFLRSSVILYLITKQHGTMWRCNCHACTWNYSFDTRQLGSLDQPFLMQQVLRSNGTDEDINTRENRKEITWSIGIYCMDLDALVLELLAGCTNTSMSWEIKVIIWTYCWVICVRVAHEGAGFLQASQYKTTSLTSSPKE